MGLFVGAIVFDLNILAGSETPHRVALTREWFIVLALILCLPLIYRQKWASDRNVLRGLQSLFFLVLFTSLALNLSGSHFISAKKLIVQSQFIYDSAAGYVFSLSWAFFSAVFVFILLGTLRNLIFIKRKKSTSRNFNALMLFLVLYALLNLGQIAGSRLGFVPQGANKVISYIVLFILINLMVVNSLRVSWINYLNKKQKLACFWGGLILLPIQAQIMFKFISENPVVDFSSFLGRFVEFSMIFFSLYVAICLLALLAHLPTAKLYDQRTRQVSSLHHLSRAVSSEFSLDKLVVTIVRLASEVTEADFTWLELIDPQTKRLKLASSINLTEKEQSERQPSYADLLSDWLNLQRKPFLSNQVVKSPLTSSLHKWKRDLQSLIAVPLVAADKVIGFLYAGKRIEYGFEQDDADMLRAFADQAVIAVENARLIEESIVKERLEQELKVAHDAQMKLLPKKMPEIAGIELDAICKTANEVGGDYFDFFKLGNGKVGVVVADVSGKGPSAAFYMAEIKGIMEALAQDKHSPKKLLISANATLYESIDRKTFISMIYGIIDSRNKRFTFCRAGHCPILIASAESDEVEVQEPPGLGLALDRGAVFEQSLHERQVALIPGTSMLLYTDGATEARSSTGEEYGEERLKEAFLSVKQQRPAEIKEHLIQSISAFVGQEKAHDDLTFVICKMN